MRRPAQRDEITSLLFGLTDKSVEFRNRWRGFAGAAVWLILSGFTMIFTIFGVTSQIHAAIIIERPTYNPPRIAYGRISFANSNEINKSG